MNTRNACDNNIVYPCNHNTNNVCFGSSTIISCGVSHHFMLSLSEFLDGVLINFFLSFFQDFFKTGVWADAFSGTSPSYLCV